MDAIIKMAWLGRPPGAPRLRDPPTVALAPQGVPGVPGVGVVRVTVADRGRRVGGRCGAA